MALNFPASPNIGDEYAAGGFTWTWSGTSWDKVASGNVGIPSGETVDRPANPAIGDQFYNGSIASLEIYTAGGWVALSQAQEFYVTLTSSESIVDLGQVYPVGQYTITSALGDTSFDAYFFNENNSLSAYTNVASVSINSSFRKIAIYGGTVGDVYTIAAKATVPTAQTTNDILSLPLPPYISSISNSNLPSLDDSITVTGGNFASDIEAYFDGQNGYTQPAKSVVYGSPTSLVVTRPDNMLEDDAPYTLRLLNPNTTLPSSSNKNKLSGITAGNDPVWSTPSGTIAENYHGSPFSFSLSASDETTVAYSISSGSLPAGLSLNSSTGVISGNSTEGGSFLRSFVVTATDAEGNTSSRSFSLGSLALGGTVSTSGGYRYHTFTSNGTFLLSEEASVDYLVVAGGGSGGVWAADGGGYQDGLRGSDSIFNGQTAIKGGGGKSWNNGNNADGGSGGGGSGNRNAGGTGTPGQGNDGGDGDGTGGSGGGGGAGAAGQDAQGNKHGDGGPGLQWLNGTYYAGGGGGGGATGGPQIPGSGGIGGGGRGNVAATAQYSQPENGEENTGGGGGGADGYYGQYHGGGGAGGYISASTTLSSGSYPVEIGAGGSGVGLQGAASNGDKNVLSGAGGSGIVIVRYAI
jgi:hypothetical protein